MTNQIAIAATIGRSRRVGVRNAKLVRGLSVLSCVVLAACSATNRGRDADESQTCSYALDGDSVLRSSDGDPLFVDPRAVALIGKDSLLVAGFPNSIWKRTPSKTWQSSTDSIFGVLILPDGRQQAIARPPVSGWLNNPLAVATADGWVATFGQSENDNVDRSFDRLIVATYSVEKQEWTQVDTLRPPSPYTLRPTMSRPVVVAGSLAIAVESRTPTHLDGILVFVRDASGEWSSEFVEVFPAYIELAPSPGKGLVMAVVTVDRSQSEDVNSLLIFSGPKPWRRLGFVPKPSKTAMYFPRLITHADSLFVGFLEHSSHGVSAKLVRGVAGGPYQEQVLDSGAVMVAPILGNPHVWVTQRPHSDSMSSISLVAVDGDRPRTLWTVDSRNSARIAGAATGALIQLLQPDLSPSTKAPSYDGPPDETRIIRLRKNCSHP